MRAICPRCTEVSEQEPNRFVCPRCGVDRLGMSWAELFRFKRENGQAA